MKFKYSILSDEKGRQLERQLEEWRVALENRGMKISRSKTEILRQIPVVTNRPQLD